MNDELSEARAHCGAMCLPNSSFIIHRSSLRSGCFMNSGKERREAKRISYICEVECEGAGINRLATRITDLSITGAFIDSMINYAPGTQLTLKFRVKDQPIETECEVRYSLRQMGMGVQFINMRPEHLALLEH